MHAVFVDFRNVENMQVHVGEVVDAVNGAVDVWRFGVCVDDRSAQVDRVQAELADQRRPRAVLDAALRWQENGDERADRQAMGQYLSQRPTGPVCGEFESHRCGIGASGDDWMPGDNFLFADQDSPRHATQMAEITSQ